MGKPERLGDLLRGTMDQILDNYNSANAGVSNETSSTGSD